MYTIDNIIKLLAEKGLSQKSLTDYLGLHKSSFSQWKKPDNTSYYKHLPAIARFLDVSISDLVDDDVYEDIKKVTSAENGRDDISEDLQKLPVEDRQYVKGIIKGLLAKNGLDE